MFCCKSKDDGASPVKKSKKAVTPMKIENKDDGLKIKPIEVIEDSSIDQTGRATADDTPVNKEEASAAVKVEVKDTE